MIELNEELGRIKDSGETFALSTVVRTWNSSPRPVGSSMLVTRAGEVSGSISGGCVEGAVYEIAQASLASNEYSYNIYGVSDDDAYVVGLTCGGTIEVFTEAIDPNAEWFIALQRNLEAGEGFAIATVVRGSARVGSHLLISPDGFVGTTGSVRLDQAIFADSLGLLASGNTGSLNYGPDGQRLESEIEVFINTSAPKSRMIIFGAIDFAAALAKVGKFLGYHVTVCDARAIFATRKRFPEADEVIVDWPHRYLATQKIDSHTVIAVLTHDPKFDVPVLKIALASEAGYVGAMGSRKTHKDRLARLVGEGVEAQSLARLHSPIGLDLGARTPEETALSIAAEIVKYRWGGSGLPLRDSDGPIHL
jgi:xanthine dehydrogenase accessory factor